MYSKFWPAGGLPGRLHHYTETLVTFEFTTSPTPKPHSLLFVGGLGDGLATTSYMADLAHSLQNTDWSLFTLNLTSSYSAWGLGHLDRDTDEIALCLKYIRDYKSGKFSNEGSTTTAIKEKILGAGGEKKDGKKEEGKIVLMGHSTGSQCVIHYLTQPNPFNTKKAFDSDLEHTIRPKLDGAIMQAPVSDREAIQYVLSTGWMGRTSEQVKEIYNEIEKIAREEVGKNPDPDHDVLLPLHLTGVIGYPGNVPLSARRFLSLVSPDSPSRPGEDDLFSSDLGEDQLVQTFGKIRDSELLVKGGKLMVLMSGSDQAVPGWVDKEAVLNRWRGVVDKHSKQDEEIWDGEGSGLVPNASHALSNDDQAEPRKDLVKRVMGYLRGVEGQ
ncbi:putative siderophore biosynthesis lipase/esterase [Aspergillus stella-maris]|uniref:putative siderophore biosynthesis lipase/esterase n=1 Tax=Aspergillus stella-maris TaxID=1810926 RepID=UPI003CCD5A52